MYSDIDSIDFKKLIFKEKETVSDSDIEQEKVDFFLELLKSNKFDCNTSVEIVNPYCCDPLYQQLMRDFADKGKSNILLTVDGKAYEFDITEDSVEFKNEEIIINDVFPKEVIDNDQ